MYRLSLVGLCLCILLAGCNLGSSARETEAPISATSTPATLPAAKPVVTILSPASGGEVTVGKSVSISITATDSVGVTGVQLLLNSNVVNRATSTVVGGEKTFSKTLTYTPTTAGEFTLQVVALRGATASDPVALSLKAVSATSGGSTGGTTGGSTGGTGGTIPVVIPNDGVCRVLTDVNLNLRSAPINGNVITIIPGGTLAVVSARLGDNSWWKVTYSNQPGWVSNLFVDMSGNCANIPIDGLANPTAAPSLTPRPNPTNTPVPVPPTSTPVPSKADLLVAQIGGEQNPVLANGEVTKQYSVTITNGGLGSAGQFTVSLKVNDVLDEEWTVSGLSAGQSVLLTTNVTFKASGSSILRVDADTGNTIVEASDVNNTGFYTVTVAP